MVDCYWEKLQYLRKRAVENLLKSDQRAGKAWCQGPSNLLGAHPTVYSRPEATPP